MALLVSSAIIDSFFYFDKWWQRIHGNFSFINIETHIHWTCTQWYNFNNTQTLNNVCLFSLSLTHCRVRTMHVWECLFFSLCSKKKYLKWKRTKLTQIAMILYIYSMIFKHFVHHFSWCKQCHDHVIQFLSLTHRALSILIMTFLLNAHLLRNFSLKKNKQTNLSSFYYKLSQPIHLKEEKK